MKVLIAAAFPLRTGAVSIPARQERNFILARINVDTGQRPRPLAANSAGTLPDTARLQPR